MQKLVTVTIDIESLQSTAGGSFSLAEIEPLNDLLSDGWILESWEFISPDSDSLKPVILAVLHDGMEGIAFEESFYDVDDTDAELIDEEDEDEAGDDQEDAHGSDSTNEK